MSAPGNGRGRGRGKRGNKGNQDHNNPYQKQGQDNNQSLHNGNQNGASNSEIGNSTGGIHFFNPKPPKRKFEGPKFGFKRLYNFLSEPPSVVLMSLNNDKNDWKAFLEDDEGDLKDDKLILLIHVLGEKVCTDVAILLQQQANILNGCCSQKFCTKLVEAVSKIGMGQVSNPRNRKPNNDMVVDTTPIRVMENVYKFCYRIIRILPNAAVDYFASLIMASMGAAVSCDTTMELCTKFKNLNGEIAEILAQEKKKQETIMRRYKQGFNDLDLAEFDQETPPENIKEITVIPTIDELRLETEPYLRPNKARGGYTNSDHYLDVQFRLLREDFVCPIRKGIRTFMRDRNKFVTKKKPMPVGIGLRLYHDVTMLKVEKERDSVVYKVQLAVDKIKRIKWDKSKRLLVGSLLLFTSTANSFKTAYFAIVFSRNVKELEKGIGTVTWVASPPPFDKQEKYLMFESEVYLEAYKHTLEILQKLELDNFPMKKFIVDANSSVEGPRYLRDATSLLKVKLISGEERYIAPLQGQQWPSAEEFGFDENQLKAFQAAISKEFSIIQGPPGTGKTFLGLKIAQVLLNNSNLWKSEQGNPITVVCYTNHALDQFLEGILKYYEEAEIPAEIIRIGGRCKSETLAKYTLREIRSRNRRKLPPAYWASERAAKEEIYGLENERSNKMSEVIGLQDVQGIVDFEKLSVWSDLQIEFPKVVWNKLQELNWFGIGDKQMGVGRISAENTCKEWFTVRNFPRNVQENQLRQQAKESVEQKNAEENDDEEDYDLDELMESRLVDDILLEAESGYSHQSNKMGKLLTYFPDCSVDGCDTSIRKTNINFIEETRRLKLNTAQAAPFKQSAQAQVEILENRRNLLKQIFRLHKEQFLDLPDVTDLVTEIKGVGTVHYDRLKRSEKWALYFSVVERARILTAESVSRTEVRFGKAQNALRQLIQYGDGMILRDCKVVGLTTTGAAKYNNLLKMMESKIVIVEEAAEVFESHIVTCITQQCEQLILIGDHRQLRPSPTVYDLATKYHLDLSLFERMINNNLNCYQLKMQHRMRPDIADLVVGTIYDELLNHESVKHYPDVQGVAKNVFFLSHEEKETADTDSCSKSNLHEAKFIAAFCRYLKLQGYRSDQITVLTMYTGQMFLLKKEITQTCQGVRITCVDNFQGEENDIILLSLVRSNDAGNIGFLKTDNRVCVALSRAKHGLYVVGNMSVMAEKSKTWRAIVDKLEIQDSIGPSIELVCQIHEDRTKVQNANDFYKVPEGGCQQLCQSPLKCTHICQRVCHIVDRNHEKYICKEKCVKRCGANLHSCKGTCFEQCPPCKMMVEKTLECEQQHKKLIPCHRSVVGIPCSEIVQKTLPCGHQETMACHVDVAKYLCREQVEKTLKCGLHKKTMECNKDPTEIRCKIVVSKSLSPHCDHSQDVECFVAVENVKCESIIHKKFAICGHQMDIKCQDRSKPLICKNHCTTRLPCGHACTKLCHVRDDPDHKLYECKKECQRDCSYGHKCKGKHPCYKPCPPCKEVIVRTLPCNHQKDLECYIDQNEYECLELCERIIQNPSCRHKCPNLCFEPCGPCTTKVKKRAQCGHPQEVFCQDAPKMENCDELVKPDNVPECGHRNSQVPCKYRSQPSSEVVKYCNQPCEQQHDKNRGGCGHKCSGTCASCFQGRIHQKCKDKCGKQLVCGHPCDVPCATVCPPCKKPCLMKCEHSECTKKCGEPCSECKEPCSWSCVHTKCTKLCGEMCNRDPCDKPCPKKLECGHPCVGFCGEMCSPLCRVCNHEELTEIFLGDEDAEDARFVYLPDCGHTIESNGLNDWLMIEGGGKIASKQCPKCKTTIRNCRRFGNIIRAHYLDVMKVKTMSFGNKANSERMRVKCVREIDSEAVSRVFPRVQLLIRAMLMDEVRTREGPIRMVAKTIDEYSMRSIEFLVDSVVKSAAAIFSNPREEEKPKLSGKPYQTVVAQFRKMLDYMVQRQPMSRLEMINFNEELDRLDYFRQLMIRRSLSNCNRENQVAYPLYSSAKELVTSTQAFTPVKKDGFLVLLKKLDDALRSGLGITYREKMEIISAMGMSQGHWFKCPNGHIYVIGDCGGAMIEATCNECGARIGGGSHQLRGDNRLATEMDGANRPAWPQ